MKTVFKKGYWAEENAKVKYAEYIYHGFKDGDNAFITKTPNDFDPYEKVISFLTHEEFMNSVFEI